MNGVRDSLQRSLLESKEGAAAFWEDIDEVEGELLQTSDEEIVNSLGVSDAGLVEKY